MVWQGVARNGEASNDTAGKAWRELARPGRDWQANNASRARNPGNNLNMKFSTILKAWRKTRRLTQELAAHKLNVPLRTWQNWEQGRNEPSPAFQQMFGKAIK